MKPAILVSAAVLGAVASAGLGLALDRLGKSSPPDPSPETFQAVRTVTYELEQLRPDSINDASFQAAVRGALREKFIASAWVFDKKGSTIDGWGALEREAKQIARDGVDSPTIDDITQIASSGSFTPTEQGALMAAEAIRLNGQYKKVFRQMVRPVADTEDQTVGYVGLVYEIAPGSSRILWVQKALRWALAASLAVYKLALVAWVWLDARRKKMGAAVWSIYVLAFDLAALVGYLIARRGWNRSATRQAPPSPTAPGV